MEDYTTTDEPAPTIINANIFDMIRSPVKIEGLRTGSTVEIHDEQFPLYVCARFKEKREMSTPIVALVSDYAEGDSFLGS